MQAAFLRGLLKFSVDGFIEYYVVLFRFFFVVYSSQFVFPNVLFGFVYPVLFWFSDSSLSYLMSVCGVVL